MRRGTTRREVTERVSLKSSDGRLLEGWALNASRGGVRVILEEKVDLGHEFEVRVGDAEAAVARRGRIVWLQDEPDGVIVGVEYTGLSGIHRSADGSPDGEDGVGDAASPDASGLAPRVHVEEDVQVGAGMQTETGASPEAIASSRPGGDPRGAGPAR